MNLFHGQPEWLNPLIETEGNREDNAEKANNKKRNKTQHTLNGNISHYKILQINGSNADFSSKITELQTTINTSKSYIIIISESNSEVEDSKLMEERNKAFENYNCSTPNPYPSPINLVGVSIIIVKIYSTTLLLLLYSPPVKHLCRKKSIAEPPLEIST